MEERFTFQKFHTIELERVTISILKMIMRSYPCPPPQVKGGGGWGREEDSCNPVGAVTDKALSHLTSRLTILALSHQYATEYTSCQKRILPYQACKSNAY